MDQLLGAGKRVLTGESLFITEFVNQGSGKQHVAFAAPYPGKILPADLNRMGGRLICQKSAFLCAAKGVAISIAFQKKIGVALFGGEGFIMQSLEGDGLAFLHAGGTIVEKKLGGGENLRVDTGCLVALEPTVSYDIQFVGGVKSAIFGGEGFFFASLTGPGTVWFAVTSVQPTCGAHSRGRSPDRQGRQGRGLRARCARRHRRYVRQVRRFAGLVALWCLFAPRGVAAQAPGRIRRLYPQP